VSKVQRVRHGCVGASCVSVLQAAGALLQAAGALLQAAGALLQAAGALLQAAGARSTPPPQAQRGKGHRLSPSTAAECACTHAATLLWPGVVLSASSERIACSAYRGSGSGRCQRSLPSAFHHPPTWSLSRHS